MACGMLETPSLAELRTRVREIPAATGTLKVSEVVADVQKLHVAPENNGALFQVASQFNLLEMVSPSVTPEHGVEIYENDHTQGPACAIACGAGTIYRNYFASVNGRVGHRHPLTAQTTHRKSLQQRWAFTSWTPAAFRSVRLGILSQSLLVALKLFPVDVTLVRVRQNAG